TSWEEPVANLADITGGGWNLQGAWDVPSMASVCHTKETTACTTFPFHGLTRECGLPVVDLRKNSCLSFRFYLVANLLRKVCFSYKDSDFLQRRLQSPVKGKDMACVPTKVTAISLNSSHVPFVTRCFSFYSKLLWSEDNRFATLMQR
ncbi:mCG1043889, partial [Mus musculus]